MTNKFELLQNLDDIDIDKHWEKVKETFQTTCKDELGPRTYKNKDWITPETLEKVPERKELKTQIIAEP